METAIATTEPTMIRPRRHALLHLPHAHKLEFVNPWASVPALTNQLSFGNREWPGRPCFPMSVNMPVRE